jgi:hypothetical protein
MFTGLNIINARIIIIIHIHNKKIYHQHNTTQFKKTNRKIKGHIMIHIILFLYEFVQIIMTITSQSFRQRARVPPDRA